MYLLLVKLPSDYLELEAEFVEQMHWMPAKYHLKPDIMRTTI